MNDTFSTEKEHEESLYTLQQRYPIRYRDPSCVPAQLIVEGNKLRIRFFVRYSKNMLENFPGTNLSHADIAEAGIRANWGGNYPFPWLADDGYERAHAKASLRIIEKNEDPADSEVNPRPPSIRVTVEFIRYGSPLAGTSYLNQQFFRVRLSNGTIMPAHVNSPPWRWYWGFFRSFQLEALHLNWSTCYPGNITLQREKDRYTFQQVCAHEMGHLLGLGDAYGANYRFFYEAPGTANYMMCHNRKVQPEEMEMLFIAHTTDRMQYFPRKFDSKIFKAGLNRAVRLQFPALPKNFKIRR